MTCSNILDTCFLTFLYESESNDKSFVCTDFALFVSMACFMSLLVKDLLQDMSEKSKHTCCISNDFSS